MEGIVGGSIIDCIEMEVAVVLTVQRLQKVRQHISAIESYGYDANFIQGITAPTGQAV